ncbi:hypothetical protein K3888_08935 [Dietzia aurantiaca]|uniref:DUF6779 domain-containing protein n=1 Tax=Dietzia aurantiaca TaxID=983873 RepID=UPI001E344729|nr:DUF6779 domain-containing protein [Dietzia aurantiaca]MCD2262826.1 hypothetical protein [Dietzia aurantiaca]
MSSDGSTDKPRPARPGRGDDRGLASIALGVLLILAVVATVVMVFTDNPVWMRVGTLAALWAAFIGAFLVARYRRQAAAEAARVRDLHTVYELQLEREISARREHELVVEKELRDSVRTETSESVLGLRQEIAALREQLSAMGVSLPEDRFAVGGHAPAGQLGAGSLPSVPSERVEPRRRAAESGGQPWSSTSRPYSAAAGRSSSSSSSTSAPVSGFGAPAAPTSPGSSPSSSPSTSDAAAESSGVPAAGVGPDATPSTERTEKFSPVQGRRASSEAPESSPRRPAVRPVSETSRSSWRSAETVAPSRESTPAPRTQTPPAAPATPPATPTATPSAPTPERAESAPAPEGTRTTPSQDEQTTPPSRHGSGSGLSVAELMARLGGGDSAQGEDDASAGGRRRRRAED